jgi:hypothetical protein
MQATEYCVPNGTNLSSIRGNAVRLPWADMSHPCGVPRRPSSNSCLKLVPFYCVPEISPPSIVILAKAGIQIFVPLRKIMPHRFAKPCLTRSPPRRFRSLIAHASQDVHGRALLDNRILDPRFREDDGKMKSGNNEKERAWNCPELADTRAQAAFVARWASKSMSALARICLRLVPFHCVSEIPTSLTRRGRR